MLNSLLTRDLKTWQPSRPFEVKLRTMVRETTLGTRFPSLSGRMLADCSAAFWFPRVRVMSVRRALTNPSRVGNPAVYLGLAKLLLAALPWFGILEPAFAATISLGEPGASPAGFEFTFNDQSHRAQWAVVRDGGAENGAALEVAGADRNAGSTAAAYAQVSAVNLRARLQFKLLRGVHPTCGLMLRMSDPHNYTLIKLSSHDERLSVVRVMDGMAEEIAGVDANITEGHWQDLEVDVRGIEITIRLENKWVLTTFDRTKIRKGRFGVWSENDNLARFGGIEIAPMDEMQFPGLAASNDSEN
jgi:hypothetical protein